MSELSAYMRGQRGKQRMGAEVRKLNSAIASRNERIAELEAEAKAWHERFPQYEYRRIDDCVALKFEHR